MEQNGRRLRLSANSVRLGNRAIHRLLSLLSVSVATVLAPPGCGSAPADDRVETSNRSLAARPAVASESSSTSSAPVTLVAERVPAERPQNPLDAGRAFRYLEQICAIGPRPSGSAGMRAQHQLVHHHFAALGGQVSYQRFYADNPLGGAKVPMANLIVQWHPEKRQRILLCAHCDTRPLPDRDPNPLLRREGVFIGASDGASGVAVLMELAHLMPGLDCRYGVDFVLFDGEELVYVDERDPYFVGSTHFAREYVANPPAHRYRWGVLLDMVGDADLQVYQEQFSVSWRETRPLVAQIWGTAQRLGVKEFIARAKHVVRDDHLPLRNIGRIPTCNIIDFDYPAWHTTADTPAQCSGESLAKVGWVVYEWLRSQESGVRSQGPGNER
jgi:hypothetical protein